MMRYLRLNHYDTNTLQLHFEYKVMLSLVIDDISSILTPCLKSIKQYLTMIETSQPFWQDLLIQRRSNIKYENIITVYQQNKYWNIHFMVSKQYYNRMKVNGIIVFQTQLK
ncbi:unnamed protein product [Paramecium primaurelia]|uniref:Uncharacterized protein n=1 Tax=Paramecium primaurelia TaxID=5886 RepID=A0A8S1JM85_PARPR|nr:unnamed protein product [Paramecium primaurelia]